MVYLTFVNMWDVTVYAVTFPYTVFQDVFLNKGKNDENTSREEVAIKTEWRLYMTLITGILGYVLRTSAQRKQLQMEFTSTEVSNSFYVTRYQYKFCDFIYSKNGQRQMSHQDIGYKLYFNNCWTDAIATINLWYWQM